MSDHPHASSNAAPLSSEQQARIRRLKAVVIGLGVLIFVALGLIAARLVSLASEGRSEHAVKVALPLQRAINLAIPTGASVKSLSLDGGRLAVHYGVGSTEAIAVINLGSGRVVSQVNITAGTQKQ